MTLTTWRCPSCARSVQAIAKEITHRCPGKRLDWVSFRRVDDEMFPIVNRDA